MKAAKDHKGPGAGHAILRSVVRPDDLTSDRAQALELTPVSRETVARLDRFVAVLLAWQGRMNLIASSTEPHLWTRHIADSLQLVALAPHARTWADLGSGAGFPGLIIACALADTPGARVHLVERNAKKAGFLREAARMTGAPAFIHGERIVDFVQNLAEPLAVVTARALAPLADLMATAYPLLQGGVIAIFPKGQDVDAELTEASKCWTMQVSLVPSLTDARARIVVIKSANPLCNLSANKTISSV